MQDHSVEIILFLLGSGILVGLEAMKANKWRSYALGALAASFILSGVFWNYIRQISPAITAFVTSIATNPLAWFILFVLALLWVIVSGRKNAKGADSDLNYEISLLPDAPPPISTSQLRLDMEVQIGKLEIWAKKLFEGQQKQIAELKQGLEKSNELRRQSHTQQDQRIAEVSGGVTRLDRETAKLVFFATDLATLATLEGLVAEGSLLDIPLGPNVDPDYRNDCEQSADRFIRRVQSIFANTHRGAAIGNILHGAESHAEKALMVTENRPAHMDVLEYRRFMITETRRTELIKFLSGQAEEKKQEIQIQRPEFLSFLSAREKV